MISIDTIAVENDFAATWLDRRELDYLIYSDPWGYADLVLNGDVKNIWIQSDADSHKEGAERFVPPQMKRNGPIFRQITECRAVLYIIQSILL